MIEDRRNRKMRQPRRAARLAGICRTHRADRQRSALEAAQHWEALPALEDVLLNVDVGGNHM